MNKILTFLLLIALFCGCSDDDTSDALTEQMVPIVEQLNKDFESIKQLLNTENRVSSVTETENGYLITFTDETTLVIKCSTQGTTPALGVIDDKGVYCWTLNGELLKDEDGNNMGVSTVLPQLKVENGKWYISIDEGELWTLLETASLSDRNTLFKSLEDGVDDLTVVLADDTQLVISKLSYVLTFEGIDASYLAGPTSYGANLYSGYENQYTLFYDAESDLCMGINESYGSYDFWNGGVAISQWNDTVTTGYTNQCSVYYMNAEGYGGNAGSQTFAVSFGYAESYMNASSVCFLNDDTEKTFSHFYVMNSTYSALSMQQGDSFAKRFNYTDKDWFKLTVYGYSKDGVQTGSVDFYLADFRSDEAGGVVKDWTRVDLSSLGKVHKLVFDLTSSDVGAYGMNTPGYFCFDDLAMK